MGKSALRIAAAAGAAIIVLASLAAGTISVQSSVVLLDRVTAPQSQALRVKNVVLMIPDGMGIAHATLGRWYKYARSGSDRLSFDFMACGSIRTFWATGLITDSAPAASAMATGFKTSYGYVGLRPREAVMPGVAPPGEALASTPVATVLEAARMQGLSTGLVVTSQFCHATPAGFSSHYVNRGAMELLAEQQVHQGIDVVLGGGRDYLDAGLRKDREDLIDVLWKRGYAYVRDPEALRKAPPEKIWGAFAEAGMERELDRDPAREPSLADMTRKALAVVSRNRKGFFLMVEGSQVDWAAHSNDAISSAAEVLAFDQAVEVVLEFARRNGQTAVVIAPDHSTGGLSIGDRDTIDLPLGRFLNAVYKVKATTRKAAAVLTPGAPVPLEKARAVLAELLGLDDWTPEETADIEALLQEANARKIETYLGRAVSRRAGIGWVGTNHSGEDVPLYIYHPRDLRIGGIVQNTDIAVYISALLGFDLAAATDRLFLRADTVFAATGAAVTVDIADPENPVLVASTPGRSVRFPANRNDADIRGHLRGLDGIIVCTAKMGSPEAANPKFWFVPRSAVDLLK